MKRLLLTSAAVALLAQAAGQAALAQSAVGVRFGEHDGYSRIVVDAPQGARFAWGVEGDVLTLVLLDAGAPLSVGPARGLSRIDVVRADGRALRATLSCPCGARAVQLGDGRIVIDVAAGAPRPTLPADALAGSAAAAPTAQAAAPAGPTAARQPAAAPAPVPRPAAIRPAEQIADAEPAEYVAAADDELETPAAAEAPGGAVAQEALAAALQGALARAEAAMAPGGAEPAAPQTEPRSEAAAAPSGVELAPPAAVAETAPVEDETPAAETASDETTDEEGAAIEAARRRLLEQLTRAADEGLVRLADRAPEAEPRASVEVDPELDPQIRIRSALDIARDGEDPLPAAPEVAPPDCLPRALFDVAGWGGDQPFEVQAARLRSTLVGEFDRPESNAVVAYARFLVFHGFGLEARSALASFSAFVAPPAALEDMARLVDGEPARPDGALIKGQGCEGGQDIWAAAAAARAGTLDAAKTDSDRLRPSLSALPPQLRPVLATPVAETLLAAGDVKGAEMLAAIAHRAEPEGFDADPMLALLRARLADARGDHAAAEALLGPLTRMFSPAGVEAMIALGDMRLARGAPAPEGLADNMEAVAFTLGATDPARRLLAAAARLRAAGGGVGAALRALQTLADRSQDPAAARFAAQAILTDYEPASGEGPSYAEAVLAHWPLVGDGPEGDPARIAVARRLAAMGVENVAETLLEPAIARSDLAAMILAARAAISAGFPDRALLHLDRASGPEALVVRASALSALGRHGEAADAARVAGEPDLASRYDWLNRNWQAAAAAGQADRRILAAWMAGSGEMPDELRAAAAADPMLQGLAEAFAAGAAEAAAGEGDNMVDRAESLLEAARRRRAIMGGLIDG